jgi:hypothetical protein
MSSETQSGRVGLDESDRPVRSMVTLLCVLGVVWAVGRHVVPFFRENVPLFLLEGALIVVECAGLLWWAFRGWRALKRPATIANGVKFILLATGFAAGLWFLTESYLIFEVAGFSSAAILGASIVVILVWYAGKWAAHFYWDTKVRLALLEDIVSLQGYDPEQLRRDYFAHAMSKDDPARRSRMVRSIARNDLHAPISREIPG